MAYGTRVTRTGVRSKRRPYDDAAMIRGMAYGISATRSSGRLPCAPTAGA